MQIFKTKWFSRFVQDEEITDASLREAIRRTESGLLDADLGGGLIKVRVARKGQGRSGGYRMIVAYRAQGRAIFLYAFAKNERENISTHELKELRKIGLNWLSANSQALTKAIEEGKLQEIENG